MEEATVQSGGEPLSELNSSLCSSTSSRRRRRPRGGEKRIEKEKGARPSLAPTCVFRFLVLLFSAAVVHCSPARPLAARQLNQAMEGGFCGSLESHWKTR